MTDKNGIEYNECVVGNIIGNHIWGVDKVIKSGTKHFRAGAKVYCVFMYGGMGHEQVRVMGKARKACRMIDVVIRTNYIKNFRLQKIYDPQVLRFLKKHPHPLNLDENKMQSFIEHLNNNCNTEIKSE